MITFNTDNMARQNFPFRVPIINYIFNSVEPHQLIKLYQCSKFFYAKFRRNIILNLEVVNDGEAEVLNPVKTSICTSNPNLFKLYNFWITESFVLKTLTATVIPSFTNCTITRLELSNYILWRHYKLLTNARTIKELKIKGIFSDTPLIAFASVDEIISEVPNATSIEISESTLTATSFQSLNSLNRGIKLSNFVLENVRYSFYDAELFHDFLMKEAANDCNVRMCLQLMPERSDAAREFNVQIKELESSYTRFIARIFKLKRLESERDALLLKLKEAKDSLKKAISAKETKAILKSTRKRGANDPMKVKSKKARRANINE